MTDWIAVALSAAVFLMVCGGVTRSGAGKRFQGDPDSGPGRKYLASGRRLSGWAMTCFGLGIGLALAGASAFLPHVNGESRAAELSSRTVFTGIGCAGLGLILAGLYLALNAVDRYGRARAAREQR